MVDLVEDLSRAGQYRCGQSVSRFYVAPRRMRAIGILPILDDLPVVIAVLPTSYQK